MKQNNFICHLVQQNLRLQMNQTDFKLLYICLFYPRISIKYSTYDPAVHQRVLWCRGKQRCTIYKRKTESVFVCVIMLIYPTHTNRGRHRPTQHPEENKIHMKTSDEWFTMILNKRKYTLTKNGPTNQIPAQMKTPRSVIQLSDIKTNRPVG